MARACRDRGRLGKHGSRRSNIVGKRSRGREPTRSLRHRRFRFHRVRQSPQLWVLFQFDPATTDQGHYFQAMARLKPGVTLQQANARMQASAKDYREKFPTALGPQNSFGVQTIREMIVRGDVTSSLKVYGGAVSFVLLIACANVANLLPFARRAVAARSAIAPRSADRAYQPSALTESVVLSLAGGLLGCSWLGRHSRAASINTAGCRARPPAISSASTARRSVQIGISLATGLISVDPARRVADRPDDDAQGTQRPFGTGFRQNKFESSGVVDGAVAGAADLSALLIRTAVALGHSIRLDTTTCYVEDSLKGTYEKAEAWSRWFANASRSCVRFPRRQRSYLLRPLQCARPSFQDRRAALAADSQGRSRRRRWLTSSRVLRILQDTRHARTNFNERDTSTSGRGVIMKQCRRSTGRKRSAARRW